MKKIVLFAVALFIGLSACNSSAPKKEALSNPSLQSEAQQPGPVLKRVSLEVFQEKLASATEAQVLDVRTPRECADGMIENAQNINFYDDDFSAQVEALDKNKPVFLYCKKGGRSSQALKVLEGLGFQEAYELEGGYSAWKAK
ncbi:MAG: rhodanese-like domain-containing protein [Saprospiraceae bacterium]